MKTYKKSQFLQEFSGNKAVAFVKPDYGICVRNVTDVTDMWGLLNEFPDEAEFNVYSFSAVLADKALLKKTFDHHNFCYYGTKLTHEYQALEDNGGALFVVNVLDFDTIRDRIVERRYPYEVTAAMIRKSLGNIFCRVLDRRGRKIVNLSNWVETSYYRGRANFASRKEARKALDSKVHEYLAYIRGMLYRCKDIDVKGLSLNEGAKVWLAYQKQQEKEQKKERKTKEVAKLKAHKKFEAEQRRIGSLIDNEDDVSCFLSRHLRTGEHTYTICGHIANENNVIYNEERDYSGYSRRCNYAMIIRSFVLNIKRGYRVRAVGGIITFYKGEFTRKGMKVEWIEQGRSIGDITKHVGFLVRGEHIEAKSLREAIRINQERRVMKLARLLSKRKRANRREEEKQNGKQKTSIAMSTT